MELSSSTSGPLPAPADWAKSLKNVASQVTQMGVGCSRIYYNSDTRELALFKANAPEAAHRYEEISMEHLKSRTITILSSTNDLEVKYRAVKALLKLMSAKPIDTATLQELTQVSLHATQGLSPAKAQRIRAILESAKRSTPSEQGGTGVHFLDVTAPHPEASNVLIRYGLFKFVPNPRQVLFANSVLNRLGFIVPKTRMILRDSVEGKRAIELFQASCPEKAIPPKGQILVMDRMEAQPFNRIAPHELLVHLQNPQSMHDLGRMVIVDLCLGNIDRWNQGRCAPGNMMIALEGSPKLVLIDHESRLGTMEPIQVQQQIVDLLKGNAAKQLFEVMNDSLHHEWKKKGIEMNRMQIPHVAIDNFQQGLQEGAQQLLKIFPHKEALGTFAGRNVVSSDMIDINKIWNILEFVKGLENDRAEKI